MEGSNGETRTPIGGISFAGCPWSRRPWSDISGRFRGRDRSGRPCRSRQHPAIVPDTRYQISAEHAQRPRGETERSVCRLYRRCLVAPHPHPRRGTSGVTGSVDGSARPQRSGRLRPRGAGPRCPGGGSPRCPGGRSPRGTRVRLDACPFELFHTMHVLGADGSRIVLQVTPPGVAVGSEQVGSDGARECTGPLGEIRRPWVRGWRARSCGSTVAIRPQAPPGGVPPARSMRLSEEFSHTTVHDRVTAGNDSGRHAGTAGASS